MKNKYMATNTQINRWVDNTPTSEVTRSLSGRSLPLTLVTKWPRPWSLMTYSYPLCSLSVGPPIVRLTISKFGHVNLWSRPCVWSKAKVTFDLEYSKVKDMAKVKPIGHIWGLEFNRYVCFSFRGNPTIFWLIYSRFHIWPWKFNAKDMAKVKPDGRIWGLEFVAIGPFLVNFIFDLENSRSRSRPKSTKI